MIVPRKHDYKTLVPGQTYIIKHKYPPPTEMYIQNYAGVYDRFKVNLNCDKLNESYSPDLNNFDIKKNNILIQPTDVKLNDVITLYHKWSPRSIVDVTVKHIFYTYIFSKCSPVNKPQIFYVAVYSIDVNIYDTMQTVMEKRTIKQLPLIDDINIVINKFI